MSAPTVSAWCLEALGGMLDSDPPVQNTVGLPMTRKHLAALHEHRPATSRGAIPLLLVEQSMPTLLRALARKYGAKLAPGEVPTWAANDRGWWWLAWGDPAEFESQEHLFTPGAIGVLNGTVVRTLTKGMGRLEALAAVVAWLVSR